MKQFIYPLLIAMTTLFLLGCQDKKIEINDENGGNDTYEYDIYDFSFIDKAPETKERHSINNVIKVLFDKNNSSISNTIAIDVYNKEIYIEPSWSTLGVDTFDEPVGVNDIEEVLGILEKYEVQDWETDYTFEDPLTYEDGLSWNLWLQFGDGTVEKHHGSGTKDGITPENFEEFFTELNDYVEERLRVEK